MGCSTAQANVGADHLIVQIAVSATASETTILDGEDASLLVFLSFLGGIDSCDLYFLSESKLQGKQQRIWDIKRTNNRFFSF